MQEIKLINFNIYEGGLDPEEPDVHPTNTRRLDAICRWLQGQAPDIVTLNELNHWDSAILSKRAATWGHAHSFVMEDTNRDYRIGVTSKYNLQVVEKMKEGFWHGAAIVRVTIGDENLNIVLTHMNPTSAQARVQEAVHICEKVSQQPDGLWILLGDLNSLSPDDRAFYEQQQVANVFRENTKLTKKFLDEDGSVAYGVLDFLESRGGWVDLHRIVDGKAQTGPPLELDYSVPTEWQVDKMHAVRMRLDYVLGNQEVARRTRSCRVARTAETGKLSDHYPVIILFTSHHSQ
ncbi:hypothetical protein HDU85_006704 [Gaertneriomyces sp. JEL0708]|nr:hypothetical protein HDU85_006704 [Gaertneriomyces sp. JEL0708]